MSNDCWHDDQKVDVTHFTQLFAALLLTTALLILSALDAKEQCLQHETYALLDLVDDDNFQKAYNKALDDESVTCVRMFHYILVPTSSITILLAGIAILLLYLYGRRWGHAVLQHHPEDAPLPSASSSLRITGQLLTLAIGVMGAQTYNIITVMLQPRATNNNNNGQQESDNPYQSLAAVDQYGHVGDNANLYYLSWMAEALALALLYQLATAFVRLYRTAAPSSSTGGGSQLLQLHQQPTQLLRATSWDNNITTTPQEDRETRATWYQSIYRLRFRTGIWVATLAATLVIVASSQHVWNQVVWPYARHAAYGNGGSSGGSGRVAYTRVCQVVAEAGAAPRLCQGTVMAFLVGIVTSALCATAIGMHLTARQSAHLRTLRESWSPWEKIFVQNRVPLQTELFLSMLLSLLLGFNAVFCTGVKGPAAKVGNLYYASWLSFLLCVRICLGCLEEYYDIDDRDERSTTSSRHTYDAPKATEVVPDPPSSSHDTDHLDPAKAADLMEKDRVKRVRKYFFLCIFSVVCAASAYDASLYQEKALTRIQVYMILSPIIVSALAAGLFVLCLSKRCYIIVSHFLVGGILSIICFSLWLADLVVSMHSGRSWAVNSIGEIQMANLYYFSWAGIITAGLLMMGYIKTLFAVHNPDYMSIVWVAICKVCFVILGAALHIWHTIAGNCEFDEITYGAVTFCSRTVLAMSLSLAGMLVGGLVVLGRMLITLCPSCRCSRVQAHVEMLVSIFLVLLFGAGVALITGIGGPGQSVGDLYYSTWLAFWVSLGILLNCESEVRRLQSEQGNTEAKSSNGNLLFMHHQSNSVLV